MADTSTSYRQFILEVSNEVPLNCSNNEIDFTYQLMDNDIMLACQGVPDEPNCINIPITLTYSFELPTDLGEYKKTGLMRTRLNLEF